MNARSDGRTDLRTVVAHLKHPRSIDKAEIFIYPN